MAVLWSTASSLGLRLAVGSVLYPSKDCPLGNLCCEIAGTGSVGGLQVPKTVEQPKVVAAASLRVRDWPWRKCSMLRVTFFLSPRLAGDDGCGWSSAESLAFESASSGQRSYYCLVCKPSILSLDAARNRSFTGLSP